MITNNEILYAVYNSDGTLNRFVEDNSNKLSKAGQSQTIGGGEKNVVSGSYSTVVGGYNNQIGNSISSTILAGQNGVISNQNGAALIADGENRTHYADQSNALTIDFTNGIYIKDGNDLSNNSNASTNSGTFVKIQTGPDFKIGSYIGGFQEKNYTWQTNYYPLAKTKMTLMTNNWTPGPEYEVRSGQNRWYYRDRIDSISSISLGYDGIYLKGVNTNQTLAGNPSTGYISINGDVVIESAKDGNSVVLTADDTMYLNSATTNLNSYSDINLNADHGPVKIKANYDGDGGNSTAEFTSNGINLTSNGGPSGINIHSFGTADFITLKNGIDITSADNNLNLRGQRVDITSNDSSVNLYAENGMSLKTDSQSINIHAGGGDSYSDLVLRARRDVTLSGNNVKLNQNEVILNTINGDNITLKNGISLLSDSHNLNLRGQGVSILANDSSVNLQAENGVNISSAFEPINIFTSSTNLRNNISLRAAGDLSLSGNNGVYVYGNLRVNNTGFFNNIHLSGQPLNSYTVNLNGNQTISGAKNFSSRPTVNGVGVLLIGEAAGGGTNGGGISFSPAPVASDSAGTNGQIAIDSNYFYYHNGLKWRRTALAEW